MKFQSTFTPELKKIRSLVGKIIKKSNLIYYNIVWEVYYEETRVVVRNKTTKKKRKNKHSFMSFTPTKFPTHTVSYSHENGKKQKTEMLKYCEHQKRMKYVFLLVCTFARKINYTHTKCIFHYLRTYRST